MTAPHLPGLLDDLATPAPAQAHAPRRPISLRLRTPAFVTRWWARQTATPALRTRTMKRLKIAGGVAAAGLAVGAYFWLRPVPQPDYDTAPIDDVFNYTLLTEEFNNLPVEERLKLIGQLVKRLQGLSASDSVLLAAFASGVAGSARDQLQQNVARLMVDGWDLKAKDYAGVPAEERGEYLEKAMVEYMKMLEAVGGRPREISDEQRLAEMKRQIERDRATMRREENRPDSGEIGTAMGFINTAVGGYATPAQRARGAQMMRDMARHMRGQDIDTGRPLPPK